MSVIVELSLPSTAFELGRILRVEDRTRVTLETMVPLGGRPTPFVRVEADVRETFKRGVRDHSAVTDISEVDTDETGTLYALTWEPSPDTLFRELLEMGAALLSASGGADTWELQLRFPSHEALSAFQTYYTDRDIEVTVDRIYNPTRPDAGPWYGLTFPQREALVEGVETGYYALPREVSTQDLADRFDISDQAMTERLRRGITTLVTNTLLAADDTS